MYEDILVHVYMYIYSIAFKFKLPFQRQDQRVGKYVKNTDQAFQ